MKGFIHMVSEDKTRFLITVSKELKQQLEILAKENNRSLSNYINTILIDHCKKNK